MSAFFVAVPTIDAVVSAFIAQEGPLSLEAAAELGRALWAPNAEAVRWRYDLDIGDEEARTEHGTNLAEAAAYVWTPRDLSVAVMVKSLDCLHTQCCEGPVRDTTLCGRLTALANSCDTTGIRDLTSYERAPWGLDDVVPVHEHPSGPSTELTPEGEQFVIPGCERNKAVTKGQLDLFG